MSKGGDLTTAALIGLGIAFLGLAYHHHRRHHEILFRTKGGVTGGQRITV